MRYSQFFCPTLREAPSDAEVVSHQLMLRGGMIRQVAAGIYDLLPLGLRVLRKIEGIVREELNKKGAQEVLLPAIHPAELWKETGRWDTAGKELLRIKDRKNRDYCFGPTHEEVITDLVRKEIQSYKQLPINLYQIQSKFRDEVRPRFGLMRGREFIMKDAYSFDVSDEKASESYQKMFEAYQNIFKRCGLKFMAVDADSGNIGGKLSQEFMVLADTGEDEVLKCISCDYGANSEKAERHIAKPAIESELEAKEIETPNVYSAKDIGKLLNIEEFRTLKTILFVAGDELVAAVIPGDRDINEIALTRHLDAQKLRMATPEEVEQKLGTTVGYIGPKGLAEKKIKTVFDQAVCEGVNYVIGANKTNFHIQNVRVGRDFLMESSNTSAIAKVKEGDSCPNCQNELTIVRGIEVGHIFKLGTQYSEDMGAKFLDENGKSQFMVMGCYGIGITRIAAAAIEQNHDDKGMKWPTAIAPFQVSLVSMDHKPGSVLEKAEAIYAELLEMGVDVLFDDRKESPGVKFKDSELLGIPLRITVGKKSLENNQLEVKCRDLEDKELIAVDEWKAWLEKEMSQKVLSTF